MERHRKEGQVSACTNYLNGNESDWPVFNNNIAINDDYKDKTSLRCMRRSLIYNQALVRNQTSARYYHPSSERPLNMAWPDVNWCLIERTSLHGVCKGRPRQIYLNFNIKMYVLITLKTFFRYSLFFWGRILFGLNLRGNKVYYTQLTHNIYIYIYVYIYIYIYIHLHLHLNESRQVNSFELKDHCNVNGRGILRQPLVRIDIIWCQMGEKYPIRSESK